jgi:hypothetical protein
VTETGDDGYKFGGLSGFTGIAHRIGWQVDEIKRLRREIEKLLAENRDLHLELVLLKTALSGST